MIGQVGMEDRMFWFGRSASMDSLCSVLCFTRQWSCRTVRLSRGSPCVLRISRNAGSFGGNIRAFFTLLLSVSSQFMWPVNYILLDWNLPFLLLGSMCCAGMVLIARAGLPGLRMSPTWCSLSSGARVSGMKTLGSTFISWIWRWMELSKKKKAMASFTRRPLVEDIAWSLHRLSLNSKGIIF